MLECDILHSTKQHLLVGNLNYYLKVTVTPLSKQSALYIFWNQMCRLSGEGGGKTNNIQFRYRHETFTGLYYGWYRVVILMTHLWWPVIEHDSIVYTS
jgi:hypothetical protein